MSQSFSSSSSGSHREPIADDVARELRARIGVDDFYCGVCNQGFARAEAFDRHMASVHVPCGLTAADVAKEVSRLPFPKTRDELVAWSGARSHELGELTPMLRALHDRSYASAVEVGEAVELMISQRPAELEPTAFPRSHLGKRKATRR